MPNSFRQFAQKVTAKSKYNRNEVRHRKRPSFLLFPFVVAGLFKSIVDWDVHVQSKLYRVNYKFSSFL